MCSVLIFLPFLDIVGCEFIGYCVLGGCEKPLMHWDWVVPTQLIGWAPKTRYPDPTMLLIAYYSVRRTVGETIPRIFPPASPG